MNLAAPIPDPLQPTAANSDFQSVQFVDARTHQPSVFIRCEVCGYGLYVSRDRGGESLAKAWRVQHECEVRGG